MPVLSQAPHTDPDSPEQTIRTPCIKTRLWNEDSEFRERQTGNESETEKVPAASADKFRENTFLTVARDPCCGDNSVIHLEHLRGGDRSQVEEEEEVQTAAGLTPRGQEVMRNSQSI